MTLENFFTLTELKDGITSPDRVKDLVAVMQKEKDCVVNKVREVWSTVADVIAVTESKDCLNLFVELDGVGVISKWLDDFHKFGGNADVGESVIALLKVLERLQIDKHRLVLSGVRETVMSFVGYSDSVVHEKAKDLCDKWVQIQDTGPPPGHEEIKMQETEDVMKLVENEEIMDPATKNQEPSGPASSPGANDVVESAMKIDLREDESGPNVDQSIESGSEGSDAKKHVDGQSSKGSDLDIEAEKEVDSIEQSCTTSEKLSTGTEMPKSPSSKNGKETEPVEGSDHKHDISASQVLKAAQKIERDFLGVDLNEEFCFEKSPECSVSGACNVLKHHSDCLDIDLNAAVSEDNNVLISSVPYGEESSLDASPKGSMKLDLNLNSPDDGSFDNAILDYKLDGRVEILNQNRCRSPSQSSSSSSINLNLTDQATFPNVALPDHQNAVFSLFGTQLEVNHLGSGSSMGVYGHIGMHFSPDWPLGAPTSYVVNPKSVQTSHQYVSSLALVPPFMMNVTAAPTDVVPLQLNLGLSSGFMVPGGNSGGLSGSVITTGKRKEPDSGWEGLQVNYIHKQPSWI